MLFRDNTRHLRDILEAIDLIAAKYPQLPQVACFDTSFHASMPPLHRRFAIPRKWHDEGVKRYGFHGLSYEYISGRLKEMAPKAFAGPTIIAHLGNGASITGVESGKSIDSCASCTADAPR